jgi:hypothetical protein
MPNFTWDGAIAGFPSAIINEGSVEPASRQLIKSHHRSDKLNHLRGACVPRL